MIRFFWYFQMTDLIGAALVKRRRPQLVRRPFDSEAVVPGLMAVGEAACGLRLASRARRQPPRHQQPARSGRLRSGGGAAGGRDHQTGVARTRGERSLAGARAQALRSNPAQQGRQQAGRGPSADARGDAIELRRIPPRRYAGGGREEAGGAPRSAIAPNRAARMRARTTPNATT
jgi:hypothetical protein